MISRIGLVTGLVSVALLLLPAAPAAAHPTLQATSPPAGYSVLEPPQEIVLDFGERVELVPDVLRLASDDGRPAGLSTPMLSDNGRRLTARVDGELDRGMYRVAWQVRGTDGDLVSGTYSFAVADPMATGGASPMAAGGAGSAASSVLGSVLRWALFAAAALGLGGAAGTLLTHRIRREARRERVELDPVPAPALTAGVLGMAATIGLLIVGGYGLAELVGSRPGRLLGVELVAFAAAFTLAAVARPLARPSLRTAAATPLLAVLAAEALRAHVSVLRPVAGATLTAVHLLAVSLWIGGLVQVLRASVRWRGCSGWARLLVFDYARAALWLALAVILTGAVQSVLLVPTPADLLSTGYGQVLLVKLAVVAVVLACALLARRRLRRTPGRDSPPVGRAAHVEVAALTGALALAAVLTSLTPPAQAGAGAVMPPPPVGPAVPVGTLAGQVTAAATASSGQLVVRLTTPLDGPYDDPPVSPPYRLTARIGDQQLRLVGCGVGCFTAPVDWQSGITTVELDATAPPWAGGTATLDVPWPPRPGGDRLQRVLTAMRSSGPIIVREATTSDYRGDPGVPRDLPISGADFVAGEPYAEGAVDPVELPVVEDDGTVTSRLAFAFPANGIVVQLWLGPDDRIVRAVLISPNHLISRTFRYGASPP